MIHLKAMPKDKIPRVGRDGEAKTSDVVIVNKLRVDKIQPPRRLYDKRCDVVTVDKIKPPSPRRVYDTRLKM